MSSFLPLPPPSDFAEPPSIVEARAQCSHADWAYLGAASGSFAATTALDLTAFKPSGSFAMRATGPALMGLTWGWLVSGAMWARPLCDDGLRLPAAPEGSERALPELRWIGPILAFAMAPIVVGIAEGAAPESWPFSERWQRLSGAAVGGLLGSFAYELWTPRPLRGIRTLDQASMSVGASSASLTIRF
jgi:hypothetical protein